MQDLEDGDKTGKPKKLETQRIGPGIWRETLKNWKMRNTHCRTWNMARNKENLKIRNTHYRSWKMVRNFKNVENETKTLYDL